MLREGDAGLSLQLRPLRRVIALIAVVGVVGCGARGGVTPTDGTTSATPQTPAPQAHPQVVEPTAGDAGVGVGSGDTPVGDPTAHAPPLSQVQNELRLELVAARVSSTRYINPLQYVTVWGRTDQGVDARLPVGAPILAPCWIKILATIPNWFAGQPLVYYELLQGPQAGKIQYLAEQITSIRAGGRDPPAGSADRPLRADRDRHRVRVVDDPWGHARAGDDRVQRGTGHAGRSVDPGVVERPRRARRQRLIKYVLRQWTGTNSAPFKRPSRSVTGLRRKRRW